MTPEVQGYVATVDGYDYGAFEGSPQHRRAEAIGISGVSVDQIEGELPLDLADASAQGEVEGEAEEGEKGVPGENNRSGTEDLYALSDFAGGHLSIRVPFPEALQGWEPGNGRHYLYLTAPGELFHLLFDEDAKNRV